MLPDYTSATPESVDRAVTGAIAAAEALVAAAAASSPRSWATTMRPLDRIGVVLGDAYGRGPFLGRVHPDAAVRTAAAPAEERLSKWAVDLVFRDDLYHAVSEYAATAEASGLEGERRRLLDHWMRDFRRAGHELPPDDRARVQEIRARMVELQVAFGRNLDEYKDWIEVTAADLEGLPASYVEGLEAGERPGTHRVTLDYPDYLPFMKQSPRRDLRRRLQFKARNKAVADNRPLIEETMALRREMAGLLGYPTWAHYSMEVKMAGEPAAVERFYKDVVPGLAELGAAERAELERILHEDHPGAGLEIWDTAYLDNVQRQRDFGVDENEVAEYFPLEQVVAGMFDITADVFGVDYRRLPDAAAWHPDVELYEVAEAGGGEPLAWFYMDLFPREGKYGHAAAFDLVTAHRRDDGSYARPVSAIVANLTKPTAARPSLLLHDEVITLFHEFGHVLHMSLTTAETARFSGAETEWDFVEAPSQIMEHWCWQAAVLQRFARHYQTGEPIPARLVDQLVAARNLNVGTWKLRDVYFGQLDMAIHTSPVAVDLEAADRRAHEVTGFPFPEGTFMLAGFDHLMGGYDAGYYGYLWSKVYGDDMFSVFEDEGVLSTGVGRRYRREILEPGGSKPAGELLRSFLGREPSSQAFLRHIGLG